MLCSVGWDYLCDWISEKGVPEDKAVHSLHSTTPGVRLCKGWSSELTVLHDANVEQAGLGSSMVTHDATDKKLSQLRVERLDSKQPRQNYYNE